MYVNHRPVFGVGKEHIEEAFNTLSDALVGGGGGEAKGALSREQLLYALENLGARSRSGAPAPDRRAGLAWGRPAPVGSRSRRMSSALTPRSFPLRMPPFAVPQASR